MSENPTNQDQKEALEQMKDLAAKTNHTLNGVCPHCGYCPTCGRPFSYPAYPQPWFPSYPVFCSVTTP